MSNAELTVQASAGGVTKTRFDVDKPLWDLQTFSGRVKYFFWMTDYRTVVVPNRDLHAAKDLLEKYRLGQEPPGTTEEKLIYAKKLYQSAFHPDSGELQNVMGRMSFQVPGGMALTGALLAFYRTNTAVIFWQWANQSFNALVNYTNRNAESDITPKRIGIAYVSATTAAIVTSLGLKKYLAKTASPLFQRFVPFAAVASANLVNIPLMRQSELYDGIAVFDKDGNKVTDSQYAALKGIGQVSTSRVFMAFSTMCSIPFLMEYLERFPWMMRMKWLNMPLQVLFCGVILTFTVPVGCSLFPQKAQIEYEKLNIIDKDKYTAVKEKYGNNIPQTLYFNKGL
ncbi:sideroflexin-2-like [Lineus longissimus]|uniref:sideroflexin-2-like n=1 Tax=Lineus longissimus TaxID=88925 RepID=UPI002B4F7F94